MKVNFVILLLSMFVQPAAYGVCAFDKFKSDGDLSLWLHASSETYREIISSIEKRGELNSLKFSSVVDGPKGNVVARDGVLNIQLNENIKNEFRASVLIFEIANAYFNKAHREIDILATAGQITTPNEFGLAHEIYEFEAIRLHHKVLGDLYKKCGELSKDFYYLVSSAPNMFSAYRIPDLSTYIRAQKLSGHTDHYHKWFYKIKNNSSLKAQP